MSPLPQNPYPASVVEPQSLWHRAYNECLLFEQSFNDTDKVFLPRVLGYLILNAPSNNGRSEVTREILSVPQGAYEKLAEIAEYWMYGLLCCFRSSTEWYPPLSLSRTSFDGSQRAFDELLRKPACHGTAKQKALVRDQYRCILSGATDSTSFRKIPSVAQRHNTALGITQLVHIIPECLNENFDDSKKHEWTMSVCAILDRFAGIGVMQELNGVDIHNLSNVMTMCPTEHEAFANLDIWFQATGELNEYRVCALHPLLINRYPLTITFTTTDPINYPVPSPRYLAIHAAIAVVSQLSGAGNYISKMEREKDLSTVLASDGRSAPLLEHLLSSFLSVSRST